MPETEYIWKFPGAISDWLGTGLQDMVILKRIEGTSPYTRIQERFKEESHSDINLISVRKKIKGYEKIRLINIEPRLVVTEFGNQFVNAPNEDEKRIVLRKSLLSIHFWNPIEENMNGSFDIDPYKAVLYMLLKLGHLTKLEAGNIVVLIRNQDDVERGVNQILQKRNSGQQFPMWLNPDGSENMDITNPVTHMFSLYSCTDYIRKNSSGNLILRGDKIDEIKKLFSHGVEEQTMVPPSTERVSSGASVAEELPIQAPVQQGAQITYTKNPITLERSNNAHKHLINAMIRILRSRGTPENEIKKTNRIDLFVVKSNILLLCEMKSLSDNNEVSQIRRGISQLWEYEFFDLTEEVENEDIIKFLVLERKPSMDDYIDFLRHCKIYVLWLTADNFEGEAESLQKFNDFLGTT